MIIKRVNFNDFLEEFEKHGREDNFSYEGKKALYDYLNELSEDIEKPIELDVVALCCEFTEYDNIDQFNKDYGYSIDEVHSIDDIEYYTTVIKINEESFIIQDF